MNENLKVTCHEAYVGPATEVSPFTDAFWEGLDGVCNALDNMEARFYVDKTCVTFEKSLLESGTMGTSGNVRSPRFEVLLGCLQLVSISRCRGWFLFRV